MADSPPQVNAFLLCDTAFQQAPTGKWCVIGTFGVIFSRDFPFMYAPFTIFICLSDFTGDALVQVNIRDPEGGVVRAVRGQIPKIPMSILEFAFPFPPIEFKAAGSYTIELLVAEQFLAARSFRVEQMPPGANPPWMMQPPHGMPGATPPGGAPGGPEPSPPAEG